MINAFILAAGLGERLRPMTLEMPKPLIPILGKAAIERVIEKIAGLQIANIGINLSFMADKVEERLKDMPFYGKLRTFRENPVLGTGGALKNASDFLRGGPFIVHNSDVISDIDIKSLIDMHVSSGNIATLAVCDCPEFNTLALKRSGFLTLNEPDKKRTFTGIAVYSPEFLDFLPTGASSVVDAWSKAVSAGLRIGAMDFTGRYWRDIGTPPSYASAIIDYLRAEGETVYIHPKADGCSHMIMDGFVVLEEGCCIYQGVSLVNSIVLPDVKVFPGEYRNCIIGDGFRLDLDEGEMLGFGEGEEILIGFGGSEKKYYRVKKDGKTAVIASIPDKPDFQRQMDITRFFGACTIPAPEIIENKSSEASLLLEDLGDTTLYSWLKCKRADADIEGIYSKAVDIAVKIHKGATLRIKECPWIESRTMDYAEFRWETDYFINRYLKAIKNSSPDGYPGFDRLDKGYLDRKEREGFLTLEFELHRLAEKADSFPKTVIHRDFQSQNIMVDMGRSLHVLDYHGARKGPPAYDIASILWDPYCRLDDGMRGRLLNRYIAEMDFADKAEFVYSLSICRLQRHMQALGAYGFLSKEKGKSYFLKHAREGERLLEEDIEPFKGEFPLLYNLIRGL